MNIKDIKGMKYPDDYFIKFFFKQALHTKKELKFLEFGAGNGSNLLLPYQYEHEVIGVDLDNELIQDARDNFSKVEGKQRFSFYCEDLRIFAKENSDIKADIFTLPNIINYISKDDFVEFLINCKTNNLFKKDAIFFIRFRTPKDFRYGLGKRVDKQTYIIDENDNITGEAGALNTFYKEYEMVDILQNNIDLNEFKTFSVDFENIAANGDTIFNSDIVIWGTLS